MFGTYSNVNNLKKFAQKTFHLLVSLNLFVQEEIDVDYCCCSEAFGDCSDAFPKNAIPLSESELKEKESNFGSFYPKSSSVQHCSSLAFSCSLNFELRMYIVATSKFLSSI